MAEAGGAGAIAPLGFAMASDDDSLTDQLIAARDKLRRELEILISPTNVGGGADNREVIAQLQAELRQIETALAND
jgi:hypothetical protein